MRTHKQTVLTGYVIALILFISNTGIPVTEATESLIKLKQKWTGNFNDMIERRTIRALVPYSKTFYFLDGADQRGLTYEMLKQFENFLNKQINTKVLDIKVIIVPTQRDRLLPALVEGLGDIAAGNLTVTPERLKTVDFSVPYLSNIDEIIVTGPLAPPILTIEDLSGKKIHVRQSSSYYESLLSLNEAFERAGKVPMKLVMADELFEDEDLLEMMNANLIQMIPIDSHKAEFWVQIFKDLTVHPEIKLRTGGQIAWAIRKDNAELKEMIDRFMRAHKKGTQIGNILFRRYLENTKWVRNSLNEREFQRFKEAVGYFNLYADQYDFDWLLIAALAYQESRIDQNKRSREGAIGVMQLLPSTAADPNVGIPDIEKMESNIHAGTKYLRFIYSRYFEKESMSKKNKMLFTFASYNAGPAKVRRLRSEAKKVGLDPNIWFRNVEIVAARRIGRETVQYVSNIYKYYTAYRLIIDKLDLKREVKKEAASL
ncbi:MltF: predicted membrane-bound lytic murein transglycosylase F [Desulfosarcina variabilis str. Montpellier]|uniref:transglycosylase SLT domain-containing protein n=1 Tax=Desulfosarcina variabilis TaxID=2300 RepID=UPI003AFB116B